MGGYDKDTEKTASLSRGMKGMRQSVINAPLPQAMANAFALSIVSGDVCSAAINSTNFCERLTVS